MLFYRWN